MRHLVFLHVTRRSELLYNLIVDVSQGHEEMGRALVSLVVEHGCRVAFQTEDDPNPHFGSGPARIFQPSEVLAEVLRAMG